MDKLLKILKKDEKAILSLRSLYEKYGYIQYKMNKFEEYDLYVRNKDFLISESVITFTDTNGKLLALKPDVTLSIIKNTKNNAECCEKLYYSENVYRVSKGSFKEIMQTGLECIGNVDIYNMCEVILLAAKSLEAISDSFVLDISHMGIVSQILDGLDISLNDKNKIAKCIGEKNIHDIVKICESNKIDEKVTDSIKALIDMYGSIKDVIKVLKNKFSDKKFEKTIDELEKISDFLENEGLCDRVNLDFSIANDMKYYSGVVFKGYIEGIPTGILSGGQYDKLMKKMGKNTSAIGFAVYIDMLERLDTDNKSYDVDTVLLYDENADAVSISSLIKMLTENGRSVSAQRSVPQGLKYRQLLKLSERGFEILENND